MAKRTKAPLRTKDHRKYQFVFGHTYPRYQLTMFL